MVPCTSAVTSLRAVHLAHTSASNCAQARGAESPMSALRKQLFMGSASSCADVAAPGQCQLPCAGFFIESVGEVQMAVDLDDFAEEYRA